jgi:methylmalonyl-CoA/ethylmalonyl-CoA epimerase
MTAQEGVMTADTFPGLSRIGQVFVSISDIDRAVEFYRDVLGMRFLFRFPGIAFFDCDGVRLYLAQPERPDFAGRSAIYYRVDDIATAVRALEGRGVVFSGRPHVVHRDAEHELWMAFFQDPDGNNLALMNEVSIGV